MSDQDFKYEAGNLNNYKLLVSVGNPVAPDGQTIVSLHGSGSIEAKQVFEAVKGKERKPFHIEGRIDNPEEYFKPLEQFDWRRKFPSRPGIPDEAIIRWEIEYLAEKEASLKMWLGEAEDDRRYNEILKKLRDIVGRLSDNQIYM